LFAEMKKSRIGLFILLGLAVIVLGIWLWPRPDPSPVTDEDPRLSFATPYRNVRPGVSYVGDAACAECHRRIAAAYGRHPMSRSLAAVAEMRPVEKYAAEARNPFERLGIHFEVEQRGKRMIHRETELDPFGRVVARLENDVHFAVGSGTRGRTYLVERDGYLFQSPISWFSDKGIWDLTPGLQVAEHFDRPAQPSCLFCHSNRVEPVPHTLNRYQTPLFRGHGIGCERCHGPGELHVAARRRGDLPTPLPEGETGAGEGDDTIVNPARLSASLRDAVCEQCHLQGESRIVRRGRELFDYRPALPLHLFLSVFVRRPEFADGPMIGGHADQMRASRCFQASDGRLGCISCHDPHAVPAADAKIAHYRDRCLQCHADQKAEGSRQKADPKARAVACSLPAEVRLKQQPADSCIECHMPRAKSLIAHTTIADHRIPRRAKAEEAAPAPPRALRPGEVPLFHFHQGAAGLTEAEISRDLGLALTEVVVKYPEMGRLIGPTALPLLEAAVKSRPDDVAAGEAKGFLLWLQGRKSEGLQALETTLAQAPKRELALTYAAVLANSLGQNDQAVGYWRRAIDVNPWCSLYHYRLGKALADGEDWNAALKECEAALRLNPFHEETKALRERSLRRSGRKQ
jgi:predicted CXXCH cytochrome family protein